MAFSFILESGLVPGMPWRKSDRRSDPRHDCTSGSAVIEFRGARHAVELINVSNSGAMVLFPHVPNIGERLPLQLLDRGLVSSQVRWVKDGLVGLSFAAPVE